MVVSNSTRLTLYFCCLLFSYVLGCMAHMIMLFRFQLKHKYKHAEGLIQNQAELEKLQSRRKYWVVIGIFIKAVCFLWAILSVNTMYQSHQQVHQGFKWFLLLIGFDVFLGQTVKMLVLLIIMRFFGLKCRAFIRTMLLEKMINQHYFLMVAKRNQRTPQEARHWS